MPRPRNEIDPWEFAAGRLSIEGVRPFSQRIVDLGRIDAQLNAKEREIVPDLIRMPDGRFCPAPGTANHLSALDGAFALSNLWVGELFDVVRVLGGNLYPEPAVGITKTRLGSLKHDLSLVRAPLTKFQISGKRDLHYPESLIGEDGSLGWRVQDRDTNQHVFTRHQFSGRFFELAHNYNRTSEGET